MATTQFSGIIRQVGEMQSITTSSGEIFNKRELVITTDEQYPETIVVELSKDNAVQFAGVEGQKIMVSIDFHATEHNGRWYNNIRCWRYTLAAL